MSRQLIESPDVTIGLSSDLADGVRAIIPMVVAVVPFGLAIGAAAAQADLPTTTGWAGSVLLLGGSAQLTIIQLLDTGTAGAVAIVAALLINARLLIYGAGMADWFPTTTIRKRLLLAVPLVDQLYITTTTDFQAVQRDEGSRRRFYAGAALHLWLAFIAAQAVGAVVGRGLPDWLGLEAATPIALSGLLAVAVSSRGAKRAAIAAGSVMAVTTPLGAPFLMVVAMLTGIGVGWKATSAQVEVPS